MKSTEQSKAKELRSQGMSIKKIAKTLNVSSNSVCRWVKNVILTEEQLAILKSQNAIYDTQHRGGQAKKLQALQQRLLYQEAGKIQAQKQDPLHVAGCMLFWGEGSKARSKCEFTNSDLFMIKMFLTFLYNCFNISKNQLKIHINCYTNNGLSIQDIEEYWQKELELTKENFGKTTANNLSIRSNQKKAKNKLLFGTLKIRVNKSTWLVQHIYGAIQEYAGFNNQYGLN